jgi:hypothetical protein
LQRLQKPGCSISDKILKFNKVVSSEMVETPRLQGKGNSAKRGVKSFEVPKIWEVGF